MRWTLLLLAAVVLGCGHHEHHEGALGPGEPCPPFEAESWLGGGGVAPDVKGKVHVIDVWAYW